MPITDEWLSVTEATRLLGKSATTIRTMIRDGQLVGRQDVPGGKYLIRESECARFLAEAESRAAAPIPAAA